MNFSKLTRKLTLLILPVAISSSVILPTSVYAQRNPSQPVSRKQVLSKLIDTVCENYPVKSKKYGGCMVLTLTTVSTANKLKIPATGFNFNNKLQSKKFILQTIDQLAEDNVFLSALKTVSSDLTLKEQTGIVSNSILNYGRLKQIGYY
ncbi:MAG: DUF4148 domain-containing protein [Rivularia sp. T60_A2020_040]|nr:DUF4148 domain-containing protein [Rivularia sp. T60_A2020_040]